MGETASEEQQEGEMSKPYIMKLQKYNVVWIPNRDRSEEYRTGVMKERLGWLFEIDLNNLQSRGYEHPERLVSDLWLDATRNIRPSTSVDQIVEIQQVSNDLPMTEPEFYTIQAWVKSTVK